MAAEDFVNCVKGQLARGDISQEEADDTLRDFAGLMKTGKTPKEAQTELQRRQDIIGMAQERAALFQLRAIDRVSRNIVNYRDARGRPDLIGAEFSLFEDFGHAGFPSARFRGESLIGIAHAKMGQFLLAFRRSKLSGNHINKALERDILRAAYGERSTPEAKAVYDAYITGNEFVRQEFNRWGGMIPKMENWGVPQKADPYALVRFGRKAPEGMPPSQYSAIQKANLKPQVRAAELYANWLEPLLDWPGMFDALTGEKFPANMPREKKLQTLRHAWLNQVTDGSSRHYARLQPHGGKGGGGLAFAHIDHRFFKFKNSDVAATYNKEVGDGPLFAQMMHHTHSIAREAALMEIFGTNPPATLVHLKKLMSLEAERELGGQSSLVGKYAEGTRINPDRYESLTRRVRRAEKVLDGYYEQFRGADATEGKWAMAGTILRNDAYSALLGSAVIPHVFSNPVIQTQARYLNGIGWANVVPTVLSALIRGGANHAEMLRAGLDIETGAFHIGALARQSGALAKAANWSRWLPDRTTHWTGLIPVVNAHKAANFRGHMAFFADNIKQSWSGLPERVRTKLQGYGMDERDWKVMQLAELYEPSVGSAKWLRPIDIPDAGSLKPQEVLQAYGRPSLDPTKDQEAAEEIARQVGINLNTYMQGEREVAVPQHSMRFSATMLGGTVPGGAPRALALSFGMFKGFIGTYTITQALGLQREFARSNWHGIAYLAAFIPILWMMGMMSLQLKQIAAGKDALPMDPTSRVGFSTWVRALATSASFGLFGDFLTSDISSFGQGPLETLAGPVATFPINAGQGALDLLRNWQSGTQKQPWRKVFAKAGRRFAQGYTPVAATAWPIRAAFNRMILDQAQYATDPDAHREFWQQAEKLRKETGQQYFWKPGEMLPSRWPRIFTPAPR